MTEEWIARAVAQACACEIEAFKPGNVSMHSAGHGMAAADFLLSAGAIAPVLAIPGRSVGERILAAVEATRKVVAMNTNLGIVLLAAPLVVAAQQPDGTPLQTRLTGVLATLTVADASDAFAAIRLASPGGLGQAERHDVASAPTVTLRQAMQEAASRDRIAWQYVNDYADVFAIGVPRIREGVQRWGSLPFAAVHAYLGFLTAFADTHVARKFGAAEAERVRELALPVAAALAQASDPAQVWERLVELDRVFKRDGINPGTSADLTVASLLAVRLAQGQDSL